MYKNFARRKELLERNPFLAKRRITRVFVANIVSGATASTDGWRKMKLDLIGYPILYYIFGFAIFDAGDTSVWEKVFFVVLTLVFAIGICFSIATIYGYRHRNMIDVTGAVVDPLRHTKKISSAYAVYLVVIGILIVVFDIAF